MPENLIYEQLELRIKTLETEARQFKKAAQTDRTEAKRYQRFLRFLPYPVIVRDKNRLVTYLNPAFTKTFGWTLSELIGKQGREYVPHDLKNELTDRIKTLPLHKSTLQINTQRLTKSNKLLDVIIRVGVERDQHNDPEGMIIVLTDLTMENRIKRNQQAMNRISQALPRYPDLRKLLFYVNTEIKQMLGTESANTILLDKAQKEFYFLSAAHDDLMARQRIDKARFPVDDLLSGQVVKTGRPMIFNTPSDYPYQYKSREQKVGYKVRNAILTPLRNKDHIIGILAADNKKAGEFDETDLETLNTIAATVSLSIENARVSRELRKAYEELKSLNRAKDKMISHLSHELKTPVAILLSSFKILSKKLADFPDKMWKPTLERIHRNLNRIIGIENEVSDIVERKEFTHHKILSLMVEQCQDEFEALIAEETGETGVIKKVRQKIDDIFSTRDLVVRNIFLDRFVEQRIESIQHEINRRNICLTQELESSCLVHIPEDPLQKTVDGLIRNAIENTPDGGRIEIFVRHTEKGVEFMVKDHGIGLTKEAQKRIFEGFFSTQNTLNYSSKRPFDFNAGGKGADLLRMKIFSEKFNFKISMVSKRCGRIPENKDACPGSIHECNKISGPECDGTTLVTCFFPLNSVL